MIDGSKRKTLKILSGVGASVLGSFSAIGSTLPAGVFDSKPERDFQRPFKIQLITGRTTPEDTVIFLNNTGEDITIKKFLPGIITQNSRMLDLNSLLVESDVVIKHGYPLATKAARWMPLKLGPNHSYLWCDSAVSTFAGSDAGVITLSAAGYNGQVMLTADHEDIPFS